MFADSQCQAGPLVTLNIDGVGLHELVKPVLPVSAANSAFSPTRVKPLHRFEVFSIDISFAEPDLLAGLHGHVNITSVDGGCKSKIGIIRVRNTLIQFIENNDRKDRAKYLASYNLHILPTTDNHCGLVEVPALVPSARSAGSYRTARGYSAANQIVDLLKAQLVDQRTVVNCLIFERVTVTTGFHGRGQFADKLIGNLALYINSLGTIAHLAAVNKTRSRDRTYGQAEVRIRHYDGGSLPSQLQVHFRDILRRCGHYATPCLDASCKINHSDLRR